MRISSTNARVLVTLIVVTAGACAPSEGPDAARPTSSLRSPGAASVEAGAPERAPGVTAAARGGRRLRTEPPSFASRIEAIGPKVRPRMGTSWQPGCPVDLEDLRVVSLRYWNFDGEVREGQLIVRARWARAVAGVFRKLFDARFPIHKVEIANGYTGDDPPLAQPNATVGFNCRKSVGNPRRWSEHSHGAAIDINPFQNPYVSRGGHVEPRWGAPYVDRRQRRPGMIHDGDVVVRAFRAIGWRWGGHFRKSKDYMHFSASGR